MRLSSDQAWLAYCLLLGLTVAGLPRGACAQNSPPANPPQGAASPAKYRLGVSIVPVSQWNGTSWVPYGLQIVGVSSGSPAERAGIQAGSILTSVNGTQVTTYQGLVSALDNSGGKASVILQEGRAYTSRQVPSFTWTAPVAASTATTPTTYYSPYPGTYSTAPYSGSYGAMPGPRRVIRRPFYGNYGDAPSPNPFSTPPSYGDVVAP